MERASQGAASLLLGVLARPSHKRSSALWLGLPAAMTTSNLKSLVRVPGAAGLRPARGAVAPRAQYQPTGQPGDRILPLLRTPADMLAMGPRVALGALASLPQTLQNL